MPETSLAAATHRRWTQTDITTLRDRVGAGDTLPALADMLQRPPEAVALMLDRMRLRI